MPTDAAAWLAGIGSIATAIAALIALVALIVAIRSAKAERLGAQAADLRRSLAALIQESQVLYKTLNEGSPLILAASHIAAELQARLGPDTTAEQFRARIGTDQALMLSVAIAGWNRSELTARLDDRLEAMRRLRTRFTGCLSLLRYPAELYDGILSDSYSPMIFARLLSDHPNLLPDEVETDTTVSALASDLAARLQSNASIYFVARYRDASRNIDRFVELTARALSRLGDEELVGLSRASVAAAERAETRTASMRILLERVRRHLTRREHETLSQLIDQIEATISAEGAREALDKAPLRPDEPDTGECLR